MKRRVAILASGRGSNAQAMVQYFKGHESIEIAVIASNKKDAGVLDMASNEGIENFSFTRSEMLDGVLGEKLADLGIEFVLLCGFLLRIPVSLINAFEGRMLNIHPSLLPKFGGKGMYGMNVHKAVVLAGEIETGITIHWVDEIYDNGTIVAQFRVRLDGTETPEEVAQKVHELEYQYFPKTIESLL